MRTSPFDDGVLFINGSITVDTSGALRFAPSTTAVGLKGTTLQSTGTFVLSTEVQLDADLSIQGPSDLSAGRLLFIGGGTDRVVDLQSVVVSALIFIPDVTTSYALNGETTATRIEVGPFAALDATQAILTGDVVSAAGSVQGTLAVTSQVSGSCDFIAIGGDVGIDGDVTAAGVRVDVSGVLHLSNDGGFSMTSLGDVIVDGVVEFGDGAHLVVSDTLDLAATAELRLNNGGLCELSGLVSADGACVVPSPDRRDHLFRFSADIQGSSSTPFVLDDLEFIGAGFWTSIALVVEHFTNVGGPYAGDITFNSCDTDCDPLQ